MRRQVICLCAVILSGLLAGRAFATQFFFTTVPTLTATEAPVAASQNPTLTINKGGTGELYFWAKLAPDAAGNPTERMNAMGVEVVQEGSGPAAIGHGTNFLAYNSVGVPLAQSRWDVPNTPSQPISNGPGLNEGVGSPSLALFRRGAVQRLGLQSTSGGDTEPASVVDASGNNYLRFADITVAGDTNGVVPLFLRTSFFTIAWDTRLPNRGPNAFLGAGDPAVNVTTNFGGVQSALPDAFLEVVPEPASMSLLALGGLAMRRRR